jgi:hypothetical protein
MTGGSDTKEAIRSVLGCRVNYIVYMLLIRISFYGCKMTYARQENADCTQFPA